MTIEPMTLDHVHLTHGHILNGTDTMVVPAIFTIQQGPISKYLCLGCLEVVGMEVFDRIANFIPLKVRELLERALQSKYS